MHLNKHRNVHFYLLDKDDNAVLAVEGEDQGDGHCNYHNVDGFEQYGTIQVNTRKEVIEWLEMIIHETQLKSKGSESSLLDPPALDENGLYYTRHEQRRDHMPDGRRVNKWVLFDQHEQEHLAVQGQERDARDGHYTYSAVEPFATRAPMPPCTNQQQVMHWLEQFISHNAPKAAMHVGDHIRTGHSHGGTPRRSRSPRSVHRRESPPAEGVTRRSKRARVTADPALRSGASSPATSPPAGKAASPPAPSPISHVTLTAALKAQDLEAQAAKTAGTKATKKAPVKMSRASAAAAAAAAAAKSGGRLGGAAEASQARRVKAFQAAAKLQVAALEQAARAELQTQLRAASSQQEASRSAALQWATHPTPANDVAHVEAYLPVISAALTAEGIQLSSAARSALAGLEAAPPPPHPRAARLELLEALREVTTVYCAADVLAARHVVEVVTACLQFPCPAVQQIAQHALRQWRRVALVHLRVFTDPMAAMDPQQAYQEADDAGRLAVPVPQHLQDALAGIVPPAKAAPAPTPVVTAQKLPYQSPTKHPLSQAEPVRPMLSQRSLSFGAACDVGPSPMGATITPVLGSGPTGPTAGTFAAGAGGGRTIASKRLATPPPAIAHAPADAAPDAAAEGAPLWAAAEASEASAVRRGAVDARPPGLVSHTSVAFEIGRQASDGMPETPLQIGAASHHRLQPDPSAPGQRITSRSRWLTEQVAGAAQGRRGGSGEEAPPDSAQQARDGDAGIVAGADTAPAATEDADPGALGNAATVARVEDGARSQVPEDVPETPAAADLGRRKGSATAASEVRTPPELRDAGPQPVGETPRRASGSLETLSTPERQASGSVNINSAHMLPRSDPVRTTPGRTMPLQTLNERARQAMAGNRGGGGGAPPRIDGAATAAPGARGPARDMSNGANNVSRSAPPVERQSSLQALRQQHGMHAAAADAMHSHMRGRDMSRDSQQLPMPWDDAPPVPAEQQAQGITGVGGGSVARHPGSHSHRSLPSHVLALNDIFSDQPSTGGAAGHRVIADQRPPWRYGGDSGPGPLRSNMDSSLSTCFQGSVAEWGSEAEEAAALALLPVPQPVTPAALVTLVAALREDLPRLPQRAVAPLCARVHDATRQLLSSLDLTDKHGEMALKQVTACAEALKGDAAQLAAGMPAEERHRILAHVHEFARDLIMQLNVLCLGLPSGAPS